MDVTIHLSVGEIVTIIVAYAIVAPLFAGISRAAAEDFFAWRRRRRDKKL